MAGAGEKEIKRAIAKAWKVQGFIRRGEARFLYTLARRKGNIVELGCWMGRSTIILAQAAGVWGAHLTSVDPFSGMPHKIPSGSSKEWAKNLRFVGIDPPELLEMTSYEAGNIYDKEIALLFIDGNHAKGRVLHDLNQWTPKIKIGGFVALHDMFYPSIRGVAEAVVEWWQGDVWELVGLVNFTIAFRRLK